MTAETKAETTTDAPSDPPPVDDSEREAGIITPAPTTYTGDNDTTSATPEPKIPKPVDERMEQINNLCVNIVRKVGCATPDEQDPKLRRVAPMAQILYVNNSHAAQPVAILGGDK